MFFALLSFGVIYLAACTPAPYPHPTTPWSYAQVRALDPGDTSNPSQDLIALYTRRTTHNLEIRLDVLDLNLAQQGDLFLMLDWLPGGESAVGEARAWDVEIAIPAGELASARVLNPHLKAAQLPAPLVVRDPQLDTITVRLNVHHLPQFNGNFYTAAYTTHPGTTTIVDQIGPVSSEARTPGRAPLLLAFWNTMPAHTPAQALRRWDGAHTGPLGQRHGLSHLLEAAEHSHTPVILLDAATPLSLAALDALGAIPQIDAMQFQGLLSLPETLPAGYFGKLPAWALEAILHQNRNIRAVSGLHNSQMQYAPAQWVPETRKLVIAPNSAAETVQTHIYRYGALTYLPLPVMTDAPQEIDYNGLNLEIRRGLIEAALTPDEAPPLTVLGGDLPHSNWGDAHLAGPAMAYIAAHPWMQPLNEQALLAQPRIQATTVAHKFTQIETGYEYGLDELLVQLNASDNTSSRLAWDALSALLAPADPLHPDLAVLRANYLGEIGNILAAIQWERNSLPMRSDKVVADCQQDTDFDAHAECVLSSADYFAVIDPQGGLLSLLLARKANGLIVQLVAPSSQFAVGLSDPLGWELSLGVQADPGVLSGGFAGPWETYSLEFIDNGIRFSTAAMSKEFTLTHEGMRVVYTSENPIEIDIPLGVAPETRFLPGGAERYEGEELSQGWVWGIKENARVLIQTSGTLTHQTFSDELPALLLPENPNYDYPPGHYFPIPLAVATVRAEGKFWVEISLLP